MDDHRRFDSLAQLPKRRKKESTMVKERERREQLPQEEQRRCGVTC
jgi:hypothetical protein